jgi:hypothetical protein
VERDKPKKSESVPQTLPQLPWKQKRGDLNKFWFGGYFGFKMVTIANQQWISIHNIIIYLETKFRPNRRIFGGIANGARNWMKFSRNFVGHVYT